jgi:hypothetical protein
MLAVSNMALVVNSGILHQFAITVKVSLGGCSVDEEALPAGEILRHVAGAGNGAQAVRFT